MIKYLFLPIAIFITSAFVHILVFRILKKFKIISFKSTAVFLIGLVINIFWLKFPLSAVFLYLLLSGIYILFLTGPILGDPSPSFIILSLLRRKKMMDKNEILASFSDRNLVGKRITSLTSAKLIVKKGHKYYVTKRGMKMAAIVNGYRNIFHWEAGG